GSGRATQAASSRAASSSSTAGSPRVSSPASTPQAAQAASCIARALGGPLGQLEVQLDSLDVQAPAERTGGDDGGDAEQLGRGPLGRSQRSRVRSKRRGGSSVPCATQG